MNVFKNANYLHIEFSNGEEFDSHEEVEALWQFILNNKDDEEAVYQKVMGTKSTNNLKTLLDNSKYLVLRGMSVYMPSVSEISMPSDLVQMFLEAEQNEDHIGITTLINFWKLVSLNPDARVRNNMFWFIRKWEMKISPAGFIIAYRNARIKSKEGRNLEEIKDICAHYYQCKYIDKVDPKTVEYKGQNLQEAYDNVYDNTPIFTDVYSGTTTIKLGQKVSIPREECDPRQEESCSAGLHVGAKGWLKSNYYGDVGMQVLVNPAKVIAVPTIDSYGKMRTCEYYPICLIDFDENGDVIEPVHDLSNDIKYLQQEYKEVYNGEVNNEDFDHYTIEGTQSREDIYKSILSTVGW